MLETIKELGPWVLSSLALVQVWAIAAWKRLRRADVRIHESGAIEIGFSQFGPTVGVLGTLQGLHKDVFIKLCRLRVVRLRDSATHEFNWRAFRPHGISLGGSPYREVELPGSFLLQPSNPFRYNIFFVDDEFTAALQGDVSPLTGLWQEYERERLAEVEQQIGAEGVQALLKDPRTSEAFFNDFSKRPEVLRAFSALDRAFYWESGDYSLELVVEGATPRRSFSRRWGFSLSREESDRLRLNTVRIIRAVCGFDTTWHFAYASYRHTPPTEAVASKGAVGRGLTPAGGAP